MMPDGVQLLTGKFDIFPSQEYAFIAVPKGPVLIVSSFTPLPLYPSAVGVDGYSSGAAVPLLITNPELPVAQLPSHSPADERSLHS